MLSGTSFFEVGVTYNITGRWVPNNWLSACNIVRSKELLSWHYNPKEYVELMLDIQSTDYIVWTISSLKFKHYFTSVIQKAQ